MPAPTITWSSRSRSPSCWPGSGWCCGAGRSSSRRSCASATCRSTRSPASVERGGQRIELSAKQFALLHYLMRHAGQVVSRTMIQEHVWNYDFDGLTNVVDVHINRLRNKVDRGFDRPLIHTLRGVGYVLRED